MPLHIATAAVHGMDYLITWKLQAHCERGHSPIRRSGVPRERL
jgi:hypothetical protein